MQNTVEQHFEGRSAVVREIYDTILAVSREFGPFVEDPKKTSIHLNRKYAFAGIRTMKDALMLTFKTDAEPESDRIARTERASAKRWYAYAKFASPGDIDHEVIGWLRRSYELS